MQSCEYYDIYMQKCEIFMGKKVALLINFTKFATELINKTYTNYEHYS